MYVQPWIHPRPHVLTRRLVTKHGGVYKELVTMLTSMCPNKGVRWLRCLNTKAELCVLGIAHLRRFTQPSWKIGSMSSRYVWPLNYCSASHQACVTMAPAHVLVILYPRDPTTTFDFEYYLSKHTALIKDIWGPYGMKIHSVSEMDGDSGYHCMCVTEWTSKEGYAKAQQDARTKEIREGSAGDGFTTAKTVFLEGKSVG